MSDTLAMETARLTARLKELLKKVPGSVCNGSYDTAHEYKKHALAGSKLASQKNPRFPALQQLVNQLETYERKS